MNSATARTDTAQDNNNKQTNRNITIRTTFKYDTRETFTQRKFLKEESKQHQLV